MLGESKFFFLISRDLGSMIKIWDFDIGFLIFGV